MLYIETGSDYTVYHQVVCPSLYFCSLFGNIPTSTQCHLHCVKSVRIRSYSGPYFPTFGLNTQRYSASLRTQSECGKMQTRITPNQNTFHAVLVFYNKVNRTVSLQ